MGIVEPEGLPPAARARQRRDDILDLVREHRDMSVHEVCARFDTSPAMIRRDLRMLEDQGLIRRAYGRIMAVPGSLWELGLKERGKHVSETYGKIASAAVKELKGAETVYIDEGNLPGMIVSRLPTTSQMTIVTPSILTALAVAENTVHEAVIIGGNVRKRTLASTGFWAREMLGAMTIDLAFIGTNGVSINKGLTTPDERVAQIKREVITASNRTILVCSHEKFGVAQFARFATVGEIDLIVTDTGISAQNIKSFEEKGVRFLIAS